jgi:ArsR family transcriptional regulator
MSKYRIRDFGRLAGKFKALSNPHRLKIFMRLATSCVTDSDCCNENEMCACVGELGKNLKIAPSTVSHHIKELNHAGLIVLKRSGQSIQCRVEPKTLKELEDIFKSPAKV